MVEISASVLGLKETTAIKQLYDLEVSGIDYFHIDVMDGEFVKNNTVDRMVEYCEYLNSISLLPLDVHLMVKDIKKFVNKFIVFEPNNITFHLEACKDENEVKELIKYIKNNNCKVGISISPKTNIEEIYRYLPYIHNCLVMTVEPGEGGQALIPETIDKINKLYKYVKENEIDIDIEADGGINLDTANKAKEAGANILVAGTSIVQSNNYAETVKKLKSYF